MTAEFILLIPFMMMFVTGFVGVGFSFVLMYHMQDIVATAARLGAVQMPLLNIQETAVAAAAAAKLPTGSISQDVPDPTESAKEMICAALNGAPCGSGKADECVPEVIVDRKQGIFTAKVACPFPFGLGPGLKLGSEAMFPFFEGT